MPSPDYSHEEQERIAAVTMTLVGFQVDDRIQVHTPTEPQYNGRMGIIVKLDGRQTFWIRLGDDKEDRPFHISEMTYAP